MFRNPFDGARAKIERSRRHFDELLTAERELSKPQPVKIEIERQPNGDHNVFGVIETLPPLQYGAIVADALGNLRSSLDIATYQTCVARGETDTDKLDRTYFPFGGDERDWQGNLPRRCAAADAALIATLRTFRPWKTDGNKLLYALSKIAAKDKHVDLVAVANRPESLDIGGVSTKRVDGKGSGFSGAMPIWESNRALIFTILAPAEVKIAGPCVLRASLGFGQTYALTGHPVIPTINQMGAMCEKIVDALEAVTKIP